MANLCIITARGGSKRIPGKNIKDFLGKPIIAYSIETALKSKLFDLVMVSTDDNEIADIAKRYGAVVPFMRSLKTSDDFSATEDVVLEVIDKLQQQGRQYTYACCLYPTAPFVTSANLSKSFTLLRDKNYTSVFPVCAFSYPVLRGLKRDQEGKTEMIWPENMEKRSQDLLPVYHDAGQFYWINVASFIQEKKLFSDNSGTIILDEMEVQDIDNETDWKVAQLKYQILNSKTY